MDRQTRKPWSAQTFGFGILLAAFFISIGWNAWADTEANALNQEFVSEVSSDPNSEEAEGSFLTESLFDLLFGRWENGAVTYDLPFPFTTLTQRIAGHLGVDEETPSALLQVLIPLGRSLQRYAAAPEYFRYPRVIVAVDGKPEMRPDHTGILLKDRLYLGYQEKANAIEVIS